MSASLVFLISPVPQFKKSMGKKKHEHLFTGNCLGKFWYIFIMEYLQLIKNGDF